MKTIISLAILTLASNSALAANCAKNPNHSSCKQQPPPEVTIISALPVVKDVNGNLIGRAFNMGYEEWNWNYTGNFSNKRAYAQVRLTDSTGQHGYALRFFKDAIAPGDGYVSGSLYYPTSSCYGAPIGIRLLNVAYPPNSALTPFFSETYRVVSDKNVIGVGRLTPTTGDAGLWLKSASGCTGPSSSTTNDDLTHYLITNYTNLADEFAGKAPFQFVAE